MWYTIVLAIVLSTTLVISEPRPYTRCPEQCKCNQQVTQCENLDILKFGTKVYNLKLVNPNKELTLRENLFADIGLKDLHTIYIENARIKDINRNTFAGLESLRSLSLINCEISDFDPGTISLPGSIEMLSFSGTPFKKYDLNLGSLVEVDFSNCNLTTIRDEMFKMVPKLTVIKLQHNKIHTIEANAFSLLRNLEEVDLSHNKINHVPKELFKTNEELVTLDISNNPLLSIINLTFVSALEKLVLSNCNLVDFDNVTLDILSYLDLSHNNLRNIKSDAFVGLPELEYIDLSYNNITTLNDDVFKNNSKLIRIILDSNGIEKLPKFYTSGKFATSIFSCEDCDIMDLADDTFENMPAIGQLKLSINQIEGVGSVFKHLHALTLLDLSENDIVDINLDAFEYNSALRTLNLSMNALKEIDPSLFKNNNVLRELDVSGNSLETIWKQITNKTVSSLIELNASNNVIKHILMHDLLVTPNIQVLDITGNNIDCDPTYKDAVKWLEKNNVSPSKFLTKMNMKLDNGGELSTLINDWTCKDSQMKDYDDDYDISDDYDETTRLLKDKDGIFEIEDDQIEIKLIPETDEILSKSYKNQYMWPILVFFTTAVIVLLVAANSILFILRRKGNIGQARPITMPRIKIMPILNSSKIKKHSGSVYRPLSEENIDTRSIYSSRTDVPSTNLL